MTIKDTDEITNRITNRFCVGCDSHNGVMCSACQVADCIDEIDDAPTVDAVVVVRCKYCKFHERKWCTLHDTIMYDKDFCSDGEWKGGEQDG